MTLLHLDGFSLYCRGNSPTAGASEENQTPNLLITNQLHYRCATLA